LDPWYFAVLRRKAQRSRAKWGGGKKERGGPSSFAILYQGKEGKKKKKVVLVKIFGKGVEKKKKKGKGRPIAFSLSPRRGGEALFFKEEMEKRERKGGGFSPKGDKNSKPKGG